MSIGAGSLTRKLYIEKPSGAVDAANQPVGTWLAFKTVWGRPVGPTGMSVVRASMEGVPITPGRYSWRIRYRPNVTSDMRVRYKDMIFSVSEVRHDLDRQEYTDLVCQLGGNNG